MFIVVGLGNPENSYRYTRHNVGFEVVNKLAYDNDINVSKAKFNAHIGEGFIKNKKALLVKPQTFMNLSGESVIKILDFYKLQPKNLIVIVDDIALDVGQIRIKEKGSSGGQNGLKNIIKNINTDEFLRVRVGIGEKPARMDLSSYVLSRFTEKEHDDIVSGYTKASKAVETILEFDSKKAMNIFNTKVVSKE